jgi:hypothetical protein
MAAPYFNGTSGYPRSAQKLRVENALAEITSNATLKAKALSNLGISASGANLDNTFAIENSTDTTKKIAFSASGETTGKTATIAAANANNATYTLPAATDTLVGRASTDTLTNKTLTAPVIATISNGGSITIPSGADTLATIAGSQILTNKTIDTAGNNAIKVNGNVLAATAGSATVTIPNATDTLVNLAGAQALSSKTLTAPVINGATSASGNFDLSGSTGTFKTSTGLVTIGGSATLPAGQAGAGLAPMYLTSGTNLSAAAAGAIEYDGTVSYITNETTSGRGLLGSLQYFGLQANGSTISTIANFFGATSNISLASGGYYDIDIYAYFLNSTSGTVVWTFTNSAAPTSQNIYYESSPVTGVVSMPGTATMLVSQIVNDNTATKALTATSAISDAINMYTRFKIFLKNGTGTSFKIQATKSAGTITPLLGSYWTCRRLPAANVGTFAA